ncbi:Transcription factor [Penicillium sp. DV-2018c]|nr:Transcription factor [Penicillium sp. DV-2018c]
MQPLPTTEVAMQARAPIGGLSDVPRAWHRMYIPQRASENNTAEKVFHGDNPENTTSGSLIPGQNGQDTPLSLEADDDNPHILGPAVSGDNHVLADYLSNIPGGQGMREIRPVEPGSSSSPVIFTKVQKRPLGLLVGSSPAVEKLHTIEKLVEPFGPHLIDLCPDVRFVWNLAIEAACAELHASPGISTIKAILLDVGGRPTTSMIGNGVRLGSAVALCHSLGLNRNPSPWDIPSAEKHLRMKIWWSILLHDRCRSSLAYGTPPHIKRSHYDVPLPIPDYLSDWDQNSHPNAVFIELMNLTDVLDCCLEHVYSIRSAQVPPRNLELELNKWIDSLTGDVRKIIIRGSNLDIPGASNLRLAYLAIRLLLRRIDLDRERQSPD